MRILEPNLKIRVLGQGRSWPAGNEYTNADLLRLEGHRTEEHLQKLGAALEEKFGFGRRFLARPPQLKPQERYGADEETSESLARQAAKLALGARPGADIEAFVHGTTTSSRYTGSQATPILASLESQAPAFEVKAGCSTSLASVQLACSLLASGYPNVLVACAETLSKVMHPEVRETWFVLADGGAALWLERNEQSPDFIVKRALHTTDGRHADLYTTRGQLPPQRAVLEAGGYFMSGDGTKLREVAFHSYMRMLRAMFPDREGLKRIKWVIPHQINRGLIESVCAEAGLEAQVVWSADRFGNVGGTSVLFSLAEAIEQRRFASGDEILLMSVGGGIASHLQHWVKA